MIVTVGVRELSLKALIGCYDVEQGLWQDVNIDLEGEYDIEEIVRYMDQKDSGQYQHLKDAIDYCELKAICEKILSAESFPLMEMLAHRLQSAILESFPQFQSLRLTIEKPHAFRGKDYPFVSTSWRR